MRISLARGDALARPLRILFAGALYPVTARRNNRQPIDRDDHDGKRFLDRLADAVRTQRLQVQPPKANLGRFMGHPDSACAQDFNRCCRW